MLKVFYGENFSNDQSDVYFQGALYFELSSYETQKLLEVDTLQYM